MGDGEADAVQARRLKLRDFLPYRLSVLSNTLSRRIAEIYEAEHGLTLWQWRVMAVLGEAEGLTASAVMRATAMDKVAVSRAVAGLVTDGRLVRRSHPGDRRAAGLFLTQAGRSVYDSVAPRALAIETALLRALGETERVALDALLARLASALSPGEPLWHAGEPEPAPQPQPQRPSSNSTETSAV
jgi:DNA-binding MarR family transcriptional regulator